MARLSELRVWKGFGGWGGGGPVFEEQIFEMFVYGEPSGDGELALF